ncbi:hypothetical protein CDL12_14370 [Handroanthus impetiginosus]|uniref:Uncharacterized protein n=1 Tax=Handroanthus impetiginosus TaxID=429701 RepID=A0A2G9H669_9LAMI|nr:hypothetical protein CDL12_14370 [Handroanthus impetiginosus]
MSSATRFIRSITRLYSPYHMPRLILSPNTEVLKHHRQILVTQSLGYRCLSNYTRMQKCYNTHRRNFSVYNNAQPGSPLPSKPPSSSLINWILGIVLSIALPFTSDKWGPLLKIKKEVDTTVETIEDIVEVVEKVAEVVDEVADGISGDLPAGGILKKVVDTVEDVAEETAKDAQVVVDAIDKFQEVEKKVENIVGMPSDAK